MSKSPGADIIEETETTVEERVGLCRGDSYADIDSYSLAHTPRSSSSTSSPFAGRTTVPYPVTEAVALSDTQGSSST